MRPPLPYDRNVPEASQMNTLASLVVHVHSGWGDQKVQETNYCSLQVGKMCCVLLLGGNVFVLLVVGTCACFAVLETCVCFAAWGPQARAPEPGRILARRPAVGADAKKNRISGILHFSVFLFVKK